MRFKIDHGTVTYDSANQMFNIFTFDPNHPHRYVGLFYFSDKYYLGGWIKMPIQERIEFDALGYSIRQSGPVSTIEIATNSKDQLIQLSYLFLNEQDNWLVEKEPRKTPFINDIIDIVRKDAVKFINDTDNYLEKIIQQPNWRAIRSNEIQEFQKKLQYYSAFQSFRSDKYEKQNETIMEILNNLRNRLDINEIYRTIFLREFESYSQEFNQMKNRFDNLERNYKNYSSFSSELNEFLTDLRNFWQDVTADNYMRNNINKFQNDYNQLNNGLNSMSNSVRQELNILEQEFRKRKQREDNEKKVLIQLKSLTPKIQTLLTRIAELTAVDKNIVEDIIIDLLKTNRDLGTYDKTSQVFILGEVLPERIDSIINSYDDTLDLDGLVLLLKSGTNLNQRDLSFMITQLYKNLEQELRSKVNNNSKIDLIEMIDIASQNSLITQDEVNLLHTFRKQRNDFTHGTLNTISPNILLKVNEITKNLY